MTVLPDTLIPRDSVAGPDARRVVWKFGGTSVAGPQRIRAVAERLVAARRAGLQVVAVLSAMGGATDGLVELAHELSPQPDPREFDALLSVGESTSCALAAIAVGQLGERVVSLSGQQAGFLTDAAHGNARIRRIEPVRVVEALEAGSIVLVTGFQGVSPHGNVTTLGRGGSDASAIVLAAALGLVECDIFTDVPGVFTADPRVVPGARRLDSVSHDEMLQLADAGAKVLQARAVELAATHGIDIHVRSSFTDEPGTWVRRGSPLLEGQRVAGIAHLRHDPLYTVSGVSPATVSGALARQGVTIGSIICDPAGVRFTAPGTEAQRVISGMCSVDAEVAVHDELGRLSVVSAMVADRSGIAATTLAALERAGVDVHLFATTPNRVSCHVLASDVDKAAQVLHGAFGLDEPAELAAGAVGGPIHV